MNFRSDNKGLLDRFRDYYCDHLTDGGADFDYYVVAEPDGYRLGTPGGAALRWANGPLGEDALMFLADAAAMETLVRHDVSLVSLHAAAVECGGRAAAIAGESGAGKTTTLLACARAGLRVYSDERALLRGRIVQAFLRTCSVRSDGAARLLHDLDDDALATALRRGGRISLGACFGAEALARPAPLRALFVLSGSAASPAITPTSALDALPSISAWYHSAAGRIEGVARALALLTNVACYRVRLGTPRATAEAIAEVLHAR